MKPGGDNSSDSHSVKSSQQLKFNSRQAKMGASAMVTGEKSNLTKNIPSRAFGDTIGGNTRHNESASALVPAGERDDPLRSS